MLRGSRQLVMDLLRESRACRQLVTRKLATSLTSPRARKLRGTDPSGIWLLASDCAYQTAGEVVLSYRQSRCPDVTAQVYGCCNTATLGRSLPAQHWAASLPSSYVYGLTLYRLQTITIRWRIKVSRDPWLQFKQ